MIVLVWPDPAGKLKPQSLTLSEQREADGWPTLRTACHQRTARDNIALSLFQATHDNYPQLTKPSSKLKPKLFCYVTESIDVFI